MKKLFDFFSFYDKPEYKELKFEKKLKETKEQRL